MIGKWMLAICAAVVLLAGLAGVAAAQGPDDPGEDDLVARIAESLGMTREELLQELLTGRRLQEVAEEHGVEPGRWMVRPPRRPGPAGQIGPLPPQAMGEILAEILGMEPEGLRGALEAGQVVPELLEEAGLSPEVAAAQAKAALIERIEQAAEQGRLADERAGVVIERLEASDFIERWLAADWSLRAGIMPPGVGLTMVAEALGMSPEELHEALAAGQTVPDLVDARGLDPEAVASGIKGEMIARIEAAVEEGKLDEDRAGAGIERLDASDLIERWLSGEAPARIRPRRAMQLGRRAFEWLRRHPAAARIADRLLDRWLPGLPPHPAPAE